MTNRLVVCGTDTEVGKTVVSALLVQGLGAHYWKPVQCGLEDGEGDRDRVQRWLGLPAERIIPEAYRLAAPVSPHWASALESGDPQQPGPPLDPDRLQLPHNEGPLVVETAGGLLVPLRLDLLQIEQIQRWQLPVLLVARSGLGTLNHTLLSLEALRLRQIPVVGVLLNGPAHPNNLSTLEQLGGVPMLGCLPPWRRSTPRACVSNGRSWSSPISSRHDTPRRMKGSHVAISAAVAALCAGILVLFTDIEVSMVRWFSCGPFSTQGEERSEVCKRKL